MTEETKQPRVPALDATPPEESMAIQPLENVTDEDAERQGGWAYTFAFDQEKNPYTAGSPAGKSWDIGYDDEWNADDSQETEGNVSPPPLDDAKLREQVEQIIATPPQDSLSILRSNMAESDRGYTLALDEEKSQQLWDQIRDQAALLARQQQTIAEQQATTEKLWATCRVVYYPPGGQYPIEHAPYADKNNRKMIEAALAAAESKGAEVKQEQEKTR